MLSTTQTSVTAITSGLAATPANPDWVSEDYEAMRPYWDEVQAYIGGIRMLKQKTGASSPWLPKFPDEEASDYAYRLQNATITNFFVDTMETLSSKPFTREAKFTEIDDAHPLVEFQTDVDGAGNSLHRFSQDWYYWGIADAISWVVVDYPNVPAGLTLKDVQDQNIQPYWVRIPAQDVLYVRRERIGKKDYTTEIRIKRSAEESNAGAVQRVNQVWIYTQSVIRNDVDRAIGLGPVMCQVYEQRADSVSSGAAVLRSSQWTAKPASVMTISEIPVVPFVTGRRIDRTWRFHPAMEPCLTVQNAHFQLENGLSHAQTMTCFPMLAGNGVDPPLDADGQAVKNIRVGPASVLFAPMADEGRPGEWKYIEPTAQSLMFLAERLERMENNGRELGRQPLTAKADNITQITTAYAGSKANTLSQTWAMNFRECVHKATELTLEWMGRKDDTFKVSIDVEFDEDLLGKVDLANLDKMRSRGDISRRTYLREQVRLGQLDENFDVEAEIEELKKEEKELPRDETAAQQYTPKSHVGEIPGT